MSSSRSNDTTNEKTKSNKKVETTKKESVFSKLFGGSKTSSNKQLAKASTVNDKTINTKPSVIPAKTTDQQQQLQSVKNTGKDASTHELPVSKNKLRCRVSLLDDEVKMIDIDKLAIGQDLFDEVCKFLELLEKDYFSLTFRDANNMKVSK